MESSAVRECPVHPGWRDPRMSAVVPVARTVLIVSPRAVMARLTTMHFALGVLVVLVGVILLSIVTTTDPTWLHLHLSPLGPFPNATGRSKKPPLGQECCI